MLAKCLTRTINHYCDVGELALGGDAQGDPACPTPKIRDVSPTLPPQYTRIGGSVHRLTTLSSTGYSRRRTNPLLSHNQCLHSKTISHLSSPNGMACHKPGNRCTVEEEHVFVLTCSSVVDGGDVDVEVGGQGVGLLGHRAVDLDRNTRL